MKTLKTRQNQRYSDGNGERTGRTRGNDVARRGEAGDHGMVNNAWIDLDRQISREIDGGTRRTVGHGGEGQQVNQCAASMNYDRRMKRSRSDGDREFRCTAFVREIMRDS